MIEAVKKISLLFLLLTLLLVSPVMAKAPEWSNSQAEKRLEQREQKKKNIQNYFNQMTSRLETLISRLDTLITRIESRINKLETPEQPLTEQNNQIIEAKTKLNKAKADLASAKLKFEEILTGENPKKSFAEAKVLIKDLKTQLKEVHKILVHLIGDVKGLRLGTEKLTPKPTKITPND